MTDSDVSHTLLGAGVGLGFGGPLGALVGGIAGLLVSQLLEDSGAPPTPANINRAQEALGSSPELLSSTMARLNEMRGIGTTDGTSSSKDMLSGLFGNDASGALEPGAVSGSSEGVPAASRSGAVSGSSEGVPAASRSGAVSASVPASGVGNSSAPVPVQAPSDASSWTPETIYQQLMDAATTGDYAAPGIPDPVNAPTDNPDLVAAGVPPPWSNAVKQRVYQGVPFDQPSPGTAVQRATPGGLPADDISTWRTPAAASSGQQAVPSPRPVHALPAPPPALPAPSSPPDAAPPGRAIAGPDVPPRLPPPTGAGAAAVPPKPAGISAALDALLMYYSRRALKKALDSGRTADWARLRERHVQRKKQREGGK